MRHGNNEARIGILRLEHVRQVAELHISGIHTGFISSLGLEFVTALYESIVSSKFSFGLVAEKDDRVTGFIVFTTDINKLYMSLILKRGLSFLLLLAGKLFSLSRLRRIFETMFYPNRISRVNAPNAELLSLVVATEERGKGLSLVLTCKELAECKRRGIDKVKVLVGAQNQPANNLYRKCGFELLEQIDNHGVLSNVYVVDTDRFANYEVDVTDEFDCIPVEWQGRADVAARPRASRDLVPAAA
jgi:ribosomal protein S18 acetylase RimI-like enzyme